MVITATTLASLCYLTLPHDFLSRAPHGTLINNWWWLYFSIKINCRQRGCPLVSTSPVNSGNVLGWLGNLRICHGLLWVLENTNSSLLFGCDLPPSISILKDLSESCGQYQSYPAIGFTWLQTGLIYTTDWYSGLSRYGKLKNTSPVLMCSVLVKTYEVPLHTS